MATFITSKGLGQTISIGVNPSTGYWKYNHNGTDSGVFSSSPQTITVANVNGEFTIISCLSDGTVSGDIILLELSYDQITSFDGTGLTGLTDLRLDNNGLTSLNDFIFPPSLTSLSLGNNQLTEFDGTDLVNLTQLYLNNNGLISLDNFIFPTSLTNLGLGSNQLTSFDGTDLSGLTMLDLSGNPLTTFIGGDMGLITELDFNSPSKRSWDITTLETFDGTGLSGLTVLYLQNNQLTSFDGTDLSGLTQLDLKNNQLTSINIVNCDILQILYVEDNLLTPSVNNSLLAKLAANELANDWDNGDFFTTGGRTAAGTTDYDYLIRNGWNISGADLVLVGNGKLRIKGATTGGNGGGGTDFISVWDTTLGKDPIITLPLVASGNYNFSVNWGDGNTDTITAYDQAERIHNYATGGVYTITITGTIEGWSFGVGGSGGLLTSITNIGQLKLGNEGGLI